MGYCRCSFCDSFQIRLLSRRTEGVTSKGNYYDFNKQSLLCNNCGVEYVDFDVSVENHRRQQANIQDNYFRDLMSRAECEVGIKIPFIQDEENFISFIQQLVDSNTKECLK